MLNVIKMDFYRMFHTKSLYVIWIIMAGLILFSTYALKVEVDRYDDVQDYIQENVNEEAVDIGISVSIPVDSIEKVTVFDVLFENIQSRVVALFIAIFAVIFSMADINSGYIKNIGGQTANRSSLIWSKELSLFVHIVLTMIIFTIVQIIANQIFFGSVKLGDVNMMCRYCVIQIFLHFALALICMTIAMLIRNNVVSIIISLCLCINLMALFYGVIDNVINKIASEDFHILNYTITGKISLLPMNLTGKESVEALVVAGVFICVMSVISSIVFERRDIV